MSFSRWEKHLVKCPHCKKDVLDHMTQCPFCHGELTKSDRFDPSTLKKIRFWLHVIFYGIAIAIVVFLLLRNNGLLP